MTQYKFLDNLKIPRRLLTQKPSDELIAEIQTEVAKLLEKKRKTLEQGLRSSTPIDYFHLQDIEEAVEHLNLRLLSYYKPMVVH